MEHDLASPQPERRGRDGDCDVVVVGAGFAGLYLLHRLRALGFATTVIEAGGDVGGTWYWNRYPGARCDNESIDYSYSFDPELQCEWQWSERYATQPEILRYLGHVADKHDLRRDIRFSTRVEAATWDDEATRWRLRTDQGDELCCRFYVMATGACRPPSYPTSRASTDSGATPTPPTDGRMTASTSPAGAWP
jgi:cation diffusion facilitator CzcD-associated flavoprotein CzcO